MFPIGSVVETSSGERGFVRYVGSVQNKNGTFVGIELLPEYASAGKNSGSVDGVEYFKVKQERTGIFVPVDKCELASSIGTSFSPKSNSQNSSPTVYSPNNNQPSTPSGIPRLSSMSSSLMGLSTISTTALTPTEKILQKRIEELLYERQNHQRQLEEVLATVEQLQSFVVNFTDQQDEVDELRERIKLKEERIQLMREEALKRRSEFKATIECLEDSGTRASEAYERRIKDLEMQIQLTSSSERVSEVIQTLSEEREAALSRVDKLQLRLENALEYVSKLDPAAMKDVSPSHSAADSSRSNEDTPHVFTSSLPENHPQRRQTLEFYEIEIEVLRSKIDKLKTQCTEKDIRIHELELQLEAAQMSDNRSILSHRTASIRSRASDSEEITALRGRLAELENALEAQVIQTLQYEETLAKRRSGIFTDSDTEAPADMSSTPTATNSVWCDVCETNSHALHECQAVFGSSEVH
ncbi:CLIP170 family protein Tip1 [Schizosaccharomyces japonicus yFS275]|uniref:CLIP170 family protein Tip1 n=1 Tax=Schizosaccharomyces japonicus (strain yFS275 / FY16936) TaxID=402676 RepID=B6K0X7_SCHJY|nr:CLIP170 family protein Tip1 [Schizosaccharomyces japonicus yFS275]EEB07598.1 CLIP170 family protein Tip1 [Schizosaccharomyces japonicus yFS275]